MKNDLKHLHLKVILYFRSDSYDEAVNTLLKIGASVLKLSANYILERYATRKTVPMDGVNKIGEAALIEEKKEEEKLSPEELLKKQQVCSCSIGLFSKKKYIRCKSLYQS